MQELISLLATKVKQLGAKVLKSSLSPEPAADDDEGTASSTPPVPNDSSNEDASGEKAVADAHEAFLAEEEAKVQAGKAGEALDGGDESGLSLHIVEDPALALASGASAGADDDLDMMSTDAALLAPEQKESVPHPLVPQLAIGRDARAASLAATAAPSSQPPQQQQQTSSSSTVPVDSAVLQGILQRLSVLEGKFDGLKANGAAPSPLMTASTAGSQASPSKSPAKRMAFDSHAEGPAQKDYDGRAVPIFSLIQDRHPDDQVHFLLDELVHLSKRIDANNISDAQTAEESMQKDKAQDELLQMELDKIRREVDGKITRKDLNANNQTVELKLKNMEMLLKAELNEEGHAQQDYFRDNFEKVFAQITTIQEASDETSTLINEKVKKLQSQVSKQTDGNKMVRNEVMSLSADMAEILDGAREAAEFRDNIQRKVIIFDEKHVDTETKLEEHDASILQLQESLKSAKEEILDSLHLEISQVRETIDSRDAARASAVTTEIAQLHSSVKNSFDKVDEKFDAGDLKLQVFETANTELLRDHVFKRLEAIEPQVANMEGTIRTVLGDASSNDEGPGLTGDAAIAMANDVGRLKAIMFGEGDGAGEDFTAPWTKDIAEVKSDITKAIMSDNKLDDLESRLVHTHAELEDMKYNHELTFETFLTQDDRVVLEQAHTTMEAKMHALTGDLEREQKTALLRLVSEASKQKLNIDSTFSELMQALTNTLAENAREIRDVKHSNIALAALVRQIEGATQGIIAKDKQWEKIEAEIEAHSRLFAQHSCQVETAVKERRHYMLPEEEQTFVAGNVQLVGEAISNQADFEVIRQMIMHPNVATLEDTDWDTKVADVRMRLKDIFMSRTRELTTKAHPSNDPVVLDARDALMKQVSVALEVALSKYQHITVANTIFGKAKITSVASCVACDRPFKGSGYTGRGGKRAPVPEQDPIDDNSESAMDMASKHSIVIPRGTPAKKQPVYRGGFKFPVVDEGGANGRRGSGDIGSLSPDRTQVSGGFEATGWEANFVTNDRGPIDVHKVGSEGNTSAFTTKVELHTWQEAHLGPAKSLPRQKSNLRKSSSGPALPTIR